MIRVGAIPEGVAWATLITLIRIHSQGCQDRSFMVSNGNIRPHHVHKCLAGIRQCYSADVRYGHRIICTVCRHRPAVPINTVIGNQVMLPGCQYFSSRDCVERGGGNNKKVGFPNHPPADVNGVGGWIVNFNEFIGIPPGPLVRNSLITAFVCCGFIPGAAWTAPLPGAPTSTPGAISVLKTFRTNLQPRSILPALSLPSII